MLDYVTEKIILELQTSEYSLEYTNFTISATSGHCFMFLNALWTQYCDLVGHNSNLTGV